MTPSFTFALRGADPISGTSSRLVYLSVAALIVVSPLRGAHDAFAAAGEPIPGVDVSLEQIPGGIALDDCLPDSAYCSSASECCNNSCYLSFCQPDPHEVPRVISACDAGITAAAAKKVACVGKAVSKAQAKGINVPNESLVKCQAKYDDKVSAALAKADCRMQTESVGPMDIQVNECVRSLLGPCIGTCDGGTNAGFACQYDADCPASSCTCAASGCSNPTVFSDSTFADANWNLTEFLYGTSYPSLGDTTASQDLANGCSAPSRAVSIHVETAAGAGSGVIGVHINPNAVYNPSTQGGISGFDYSEMNAVVSGLLQGTGPAVEQDGNLYIMQPNLLTTSGGTCTESVAESMEAADLCLVLPSGSNPATYGPYVDCNQNPDFTCSGSEIAFGFFRQNSTHSGGYDTLVTMDSWRVAVCRTPCP